MNEIINGLVTGLTLQLAIGPVFFFIVNLTLQKTIFDGLAGVFGVTLADYTYIFLAIFGIGQLLKHQMYKRVFGIISPVVLIMFGLIILKGAITATSVGALEPSASNILVSFISVFLLTISSPLTIVLFTSLFAVKAMEYKYTKYQLFLFGLGTGFATFLFMGSSVIVFTSIKGAVPIVLIKILNSLVGILLVVYGGLRLYKTISEKQRKRLG